MINVDDTLLGTWTIHVNALLLHWEVKKLKRKMIIFQNKFTVQKGLRFLKVKQKPIKKVFIAPPH